MRAVDAIDPFSSFSFARYDFERSEFYADLHVYTSDETLLELAEVVCILATIPSLQNVSL